MKYWTFQRKFVLDVIDKEDCYQPDFTKSEYLSFNQNLSPLYNLILGSYNKNNGTKLPGLIFSFAKIKNNRIAEISDLNELKSFMESKPDVLETLAEHYKTDDMVVLELEYSQNFNPIYVDYNDFQFLMPPCEPIPPYFNEGDEERIRIAIKKGHFYQSKFPAGIVQAHLPNISKSNIVSRDAFDFKMFF